VRNGVFCHLLKNDVFTVATKALSQCLEFLRDVDRIQTAASVLGWRSRDYGPTIRWPCTGT